MGRNSIHWEKVKNSLPKDSNVGDVSARGIRKDGRELPVKVTERLMESKSIH